MSADRKLTDLCGGRFAIVPAEAADDDSLSDGALRLYVKLCGHATPSGICELCVKAYATACGVTPRAVQKWKRELELAGRLVQLHDGDKAKGLYRIIRNPAERHSAMLENAPKLADRQRAKTPSGAQPSIPANVGSHPRCERQFAHKQDLEHNPPLSPPSTKPAETRPEETNNCSAREPNSRQARGSGALALGASCIARAENRASGATRLERLGAVARARPTDRRALGMDLGAHRVDPDRAGNQRRGG